VTEAAGSAGFTERAGLLDHAKQLVSGDRDATYGPPTEHHAATAAAWSAVFGHQFTASDVARAFIIDKLVRLNNSPGHRDSWADIAGYAGCGWESAVAEAKRHG
jgi:hypothetical protein